MTINQPTLDIILPCYNPSTEFVETFRAISDSLINRYCDHSLRFIVVNDGSASNFGKQEQHSLLNTVEHVRIINLESNQGKGVAVRTGIQASTAQYAIYTDCDMPYSLNTMEQVIDRVFDGYDVVIAIRNHNYYRQLSPLRKVLSIGSKSLNRLFLRTKHTDTQGGLKGFSPRAKEIMLQTKIDSFLFDTEFIALASRNKQIRITEVESTLRDGIELSKMSWGVIAKELRNFLYIAFTRFS